MRRLVAAVAGALLPPGMRRSVAMAAGRVWPASKRITAHENGTFVGYPTTYNADGFATVHSADFLADPKFMAAYAEGMDGVPPALQFDVRWRAHICLWAARRALALPEGDFVDCGVWYGILPRTMAAYVGFDRYPQRRWYLVDPWGHLGVAGLEHYEPDIFDAVKRRFERYPNIELVRGTVPEVLPQVRTDRVAYLALDMNGSKPELAALEHFYPRLVPGGVVYLDDYGWGAGEFTEQRRVIDTFLAGKPETVLRFPSGQAVIVKV